MQLNVRICLVDFFVILYQLFFCGLNRWWPLGFTRAKVTHTTGHVNYASERGIERGHLYWATHTISLSLFLSLILLMCKRHFFSSSLLRKLAWEIFDTHHNFSCVLSMGQNFGDGIKNTNSKLNSRLSCVLKYNEILTLIFDLVIYKYWQNEYWFISLFLSCKKSNSKEGFIPK